MDAEEAFRIVAELGDDPDYLEKEAQRHDPLYEELIRRAGILPGSRVLELGVGTAIMAVKLAQRIGSRGRIYGIDGNQRMLEVAGDKKRRLGLSNLELKKMSWNSSDFRTTASTTLSPTLECVAPSTMTRHCVRPIGFSGHAEN